MNYYEQRIEKLNKSELPTQIFGDGRNYKSSNNEIWESLKVGDVIFPTVWMLRNVSNINNVANIAKNGLTITEKGQRYISELSWKFGEWEGGNVNCLFFEEIVTTLSFHKSISQQIWKINNTELV